MVVVACCKWPHALAFVPSVRFQEARQAALREQEKKAKEEEVSLVRSSSQDLRIMLCHLGQIVVGRGILSARLESQLS